jgi:colicin import membrane protein
MAAFVYNEPYKYSSVLLTLAMHAIFFTALYLGVNWQVRQPEGMEVELWGELPETNAHPAPMAPPAETPPPKPVQAKPKPAETPAPPAKSDIDLAGGKKKTEVSKPKEATKPEQKKKPSKAELKRNQEDMQVADQGADVAVSKEQADNKEKAALAAKANAAIKSEVEKYKELIRSKIRNNIVLPPDVPDNALAVFVITLLPDGSVLLDDVKLVKSSGNAAYDSAVERAILKTNTLPLPKDEAARARFINPNHLELKFSPKDGE